MLSSLTYCGCVEYPRGLRLCVGLVRLFLVMGKRTWWLTLAAGIQFCGLSALVEEAPDREYRDGS